MVIVTTTDWKLGRPSHKLGDQLAGLYWVLEKVGNAYRLELPENIWVHPIFTPEKLRRAATTELLLGQLQDPTPAIKVNGKEEWEVQEVVAVRLYYQKLQYRVCWTGHDMDLV